MSSDSACAIRRRRNVDFRGVSCSLLVLGANLSLEVHYLIFPYKIDGASSEPSTRHSGSVDTFNVASEVHHHIQLTTTHFKIITKARVRICHQFSHSPHIRSQ